MQSTKKTIKIITIYIMTFIICSVVFVEIFNQYKDYNMTLDERLHSYGLSRQYLANTLKNLNNQGVTDPIEFQRRLRWYIKDEDLRKEFAINDMGNITFVYRGKELDETLVEKGFGITKSTILSKIKRIFNVQPGAFE